MHSIRLCYYPGCKNTKKSRPDLSFHHFPIKKETFSSWIQRCGHTAFVTENSSKWKSRVICSSHFNPLMDFKDGARPTLKRDAVPVDFTAIGQWSPMDNRYILINENDDDGHSSQTTDYNFKYIVSKCRTNQKKSNASRLISLLKNSSRSQNLFLLEMQVRHLKKRSWTDVEKDFAISIYQSSSQCYKLLREEYNMALPCVTLIRQWINEIKIGRCINQKKTYFNKLKNTSNQLKQ